MIRLQQHQNTVVMLDIASNCPRITNIHQIPLVDKVVVHLSFVAASGRTSKGETSVDFLNYITPGLAGLELITGQKPTIHYSSKAVSRWRMRKGDIVGLSVSLHKDKAYSFLDKLISVVFPRVKELHLPSKLTPQGNLSFHLDNMQVFPEIEKEYVFFGGADLPLDITIVTKGTGSKAHCDLLLKSLQFPFKQQ